MSLPCNNEDVPELLHGIGDYVARLQAQSREAAAQVVQLQAQVCSLEQEVRVLQRRLQLAEAREQIQADCSACLAEQLAAAKDAAAVAARACEDERQAGVARSKEADESRHRLEQLLAQEEQRSKLLADELQQGREQASQEQQQRLYDHRAAEVERQQLQSELAAVQHERQRLQKELATYSTAHPPAELAHLEQEVAQLRQQLEKEQQEKKHALERRAKYKHLFAQVAAAYRQTKNAYSRLKIEKSAKSSARAAPPCPGQQSAVSGRLTPDTADGEHWQDSADSEREPVDQDLPVCGSSKRRRASGGSSKEPADEQQGRSGCGGSRQGRGATSSDQQAVEQPGHLLPSQQAGSTHLLPSQQALKSAASRDAGASILTGGELPAQAVAMPTTMTAGEPHSCPSASNCQPAPAVTTTTVKLEGAGSPPSNMNPAGSCENSQKPQTAGCPLLNPCWDPAAPTLEPLRPMNPPAPRRCPPVPAAPTLGRTSSPTAQQPPEAGPSQAAVVLVQPLAQPPRCAAVCDATQPDTFQPLHQLARTPQSKQPLKRPCPERAPETISHPSAAPAKQLALDAPTAPSWGPAWERQAAGMAAEVGPAWKKVARPGDCDQRAFNAVDDRPPSDYTLQMLPQQQDAAVASALAPGAQFSRRGSIDSSKGGPPGAPTGSGGPGYKYQDVVRKQDERQKLKGTECLQCQRFYEALQTWGTVAGGEPLPGCGHVPRGTVPAALAGPLVSRDELREAGSRHRYRYQPPATPDEFWNMGFGTTD